ncbi:M6 family metalloprotease domain-containing protein [Luteolibacter yonseiensis]|uniref:M6 family metalloprotease domain-containing protein n=1 Tax=Luteolibacter yonseiensis TaxID=1144680 RepID=A0A934R0Y8_9BACT|nr:M6 family metalloprotease domain-containing protein [Luteolibacter yonseiensis]MBK1814472.1 M6 family metalloprotease domain-containing protein [Luteolibacter yonseiensis]
MKKSLLFRQLRLLALFAGGIGSAVAAPYGPDGRETKWTQPDGKVLQLKVFGDEYYGRTETSDGFSVYLNQADKTYYYAVLGADKKSFVSSGTRADAPAPAGLEKHLEQAGEVVDSIIGENHSKFEGDRADRWNKRVDAVQTLRSAAKGAGINRAAVDAAEILAAPVNGSKVGLTILVQFPDDTRTTRVDPTNFPTNREKIVRFCNNVGYTENGNTGSVRDYFSDQSLGALTYTQSVTQIVTLPHPRDYYNYSDYPANQELYEDIGASATEIISDAVVILKQQGFDFSGLSLNGDRILATNVFFAGDDSGAWSFGLWPHQSTVRGEINVGTEEAPLYVGDYQITNLPDTAPVIGTFCHENGHLLLNYPDLYSSKLVPNTNRTEQGVGEHCLMGSANHLNNGKTPGPINAYFKELVGWGNITDMASDDFQKVKLPTTGNVARRILNPADARESFVIENRGNGDKWAQYVPDKGIVIWHIDGKVSGNMSGNPHYQVAVMQADGRRDLERGVNRGDGSDLFDSSDPNFNDTTTPNAKWWDNSNSFIGVKVRSAPGNTMIVDFGALKPNTARVFSPNGGEVLFRGSVFPVTWGANITGNVKIELLKAGALHSVIAANRANDGSFAWTVPTTLVPATDYSIRVSSLTNTVPATDSSNGNFSVTAGTFPAGGEMPYGWSKPSGVQAGWSVTKSEVYEGARCLATNKMGDGKTAGIAYRSHFKAGVVSFYIKVSSELGYDYARFYIDGEEQLINDERGISGNGKWIYVSYPVTAGTHTFKWTYQKDETYGDMQDTVWLDGVTMPATTQEIAVTNPLGEDIVSGASTTVCPSVGVRYSAAPVTFTIRNVGQADLTGISVKTIGANSGDFIVQKLTKTAVSAGQNATFQVVFKPTAVGARTATLQIRSSDGDEGIFSVALNGTGLESSRIGVYQASKALTDNVSIVTFAKTETKNKGQTKTIVVKNTGSAVLDRLAISVSGPKSKDFVVSPTSLAPLAPGASASFNVSFRPTEPKKGKQRDAVINISSNDYATGQFQVLLAGNSDPVKKAKAQAATTLAQAASPSGITRFSVADPAGASVTLKATAGVEVISGKKYRSLTITKNAGVSGTVEVSSNLLDWYSGKKHTTVLIDNATTLKVRDNTPFTSDSKRYIRLR